MREIPLTQGKVALVDDSKYEELSKYNWYAGQYQKNFYAMRNSSRKKGKHFMILMHRQILGLEYGDPRQTDHRDHNTLDNRRANIRICTNQQNSRNRKSNQNLTSQFKGVSWNKREKKWGSYIHINEKTRFLGYWNMEEVAALRYDMVAIREFGEFAHLNFN